MEICEVCDVMVRAVNQVDSHCLPVPRCASVGEIIWRNPCQITSVKQVPAVRS